MPSEQTKNFAVSTVATAPSPASSGTSLVVESGHGGRFPAAAFNAVVCPADAQPTPANAEVVRVTAGFGTDTFTITRAQESSSARSIVVGDRIFAGVTVATLNEFYTKVESDFITGALQARSTLTTKGDLYAATAASAVARLAAGANEEVPIYDSAQSTGFKTSTPLGGLKGYVPIFVSPMGLRAAASAAFTRGVLHQVLTSGYYAFSTSPTANGIASGIVLNPTNFDISERTTRLKTSITAFTNATAPTVNWTVGLSAVSSAGGAGVQSFSWSADVSGSTATVTAPAASSVVTAVSSAFDLPAAGYYALQATQSGTSAANASVAFQMALWMTHV